MTLSGTSITWRGLTFGGSIRDRYTVKSLEGWEDTPDTEQNSDRRPQGHGRFDSPVWSDERIVTVGGSCYSPTERDALLAEMKSVMALSSPDGGTEDLTITNAGVTLTGFARLRRFRPVIGAGWAAGHFDWAAEWRCPDPLRYSAPVSVSTGFPVLRGGLAYDLYTDGAGTDLGYLDYGEASDTGRLSLTNDGNADVWPVFEATGPVEPQGFEIVRVGTDRRIRFQGPVPAGSPLVIDSATGLATLDGTADRGDMLTVREWSPIRPGESAEFAFIPLGTYSSASLTAVIRPGWW